MTKLTVAWDMVDNKNADDGANDDNDGRAGSSEENRKRPAVALAPPVTQDGEDDAHGDIGRKGVGFGNAVGSCCHC